MQLPFIAKTAEFEPEIIRARINSVTFKFTQSMEEPMRRSAALILTGLMIALSACDSTRNGRDAVQRSSSPTAGASEAQAGGQFAGEKMATESLSAPRRSPAAPVPALPGDRGVQEIQLDSAGAAQAFMRKVIQNAEMTIETDKPGEGQQKIGVIAEKHGGFVVISESKHNEAASQNIASTVVNVVVRVPAQKFQATIDEIRAVGGRIL
ncbi:MAG TPA: DUF4349 domain-containing protein, partial [Blastocatellia bacterium]|nr:DUF4349 domain-containing protein [Blastocatellia bacterium]